MKRYEAVQAHRSQFPVTKMCRILSISESGFYKWSNRFPSPRELEDIELTIRIKELYNEHNGHAGVPMITADLKSDERFSHVGKRRVARIMRENNLRCRYTRKYKTTTDSRHNEPVAENILDRNFQVSVPNEVWVGDITYLKIGSQWYYLSVFIDLFSRMVVGWDLSDSLERSSTIKALRKAIMRRQPGPGLMIHSDRGGQYASCEFRELLQKRGFIQSMSRKGNCWDNAVAESFFHTLKNQYLHHTVFRNSTEAGYGLFKYIEVYYNRRRRHSTNGWKSPVQYETDWYEMKKAA